ncbi:hypothetical protein [Rhizobacter fulvus]
MSRPAGPAASVVLTPSVRRPAGDRARRGGWRIAAFLSLVVALAFALDAFIGFGLRSVSTGDFGEWNRIVDGRINADIVISGSSRALTHYDPRLLASATGLSAYNIGLNGSQTDMQLARLKTYLRHNRKPRLVIHNLDAFSFQVSHDGVYDPGQYVPYLREPDLYDALVRIDADAWKARLLPLYGYAAQDLRFGWLQGLRQWLRPPAAPTHFRGYQPRDTEWTGEFDRFRVRHPEGVNVGIEPAGVARMEELLRLCATQGIRVVLAYSPEYREMQALTINRAEIFARFAALSNQYDAVLLDFADSPISSRAAYFYNSQHLNTVGAAAFTHELVARLNADGVLAGLNGER